MKSFELVSSLLLVLLLASCVEAQTRVTCDPLVGSVNSSRLCIKFEIKDGRVAVDRTQSVFNSTPLFTQRLTISKVEAESFLFSELQRLLDRVERPYRLALSEDERRLDDNGQLNDAPTKRIRTFSGSWQAYLQQFQEWATETNKMLGVGDIFPESEATASGGLLFPLATSQESTALLIYEDAGYEAEEGLIRFAVADPINDWSSSEQVVIKLPGVTEAKKKDARLKRIREVLQPLSGRPRCLECINTRVESFYKRLGLTPNLIFDNKGTSPLELNIVEGARIVGISWLSLKDNDKNIDKVLYSLITESAFRSFLKHRTEVTTQKQFNYIQRTGKAGPYLNPTRLQIQQLLVNQLGYSISFSFAPNATEPLASNYNLTIQKNTEDESTPPSENDTPESAPATSNNEGVVTAHEQENEAETEFTKREKEDKELKDKKRYVGAGLEYKPDQGLRFFGLGQLSRFPLLPDATNNLSATGGGQGSTGPIGSVNYFADYVFFNKLRRRVSFQLTTSSDLDANRNLGVAPVDERQSFGLARLEFEAFRDWSGSLLRFYLEGRHETVALESSLGPTAKVNLNTLDFAGLYLFESSEVENRRRVRVQPLLRIGLGLAVNEPRYNKLVVAGNFHQALPSRFEFELNGRVETASKETPRFEFPSLGGADIVRGFRRDDVLGRKLWSLQNELWIPLPLGDESSKGLSAMIREKVKLAPFVDVGGVYETVTSTPGIRSGVGMGIRFIYTPIIFKIDYGYGFGPKVNSGGRGKFYFSITSNLPF